MFEILAIQPAQTKKVQKKQSTTTTKTTGTTTVPVGQKQATSQPKTLIVPNLSENDEIQSYILNIQEKLGINYTLTLTKDSTSMLRKSQNNLIDLIKYYEGDPNYYYEGFTAIYSDSFGKKTTGFGHYYPKKNIKTQEEAYKTLADDLIRVQKELSKNIGSENFKKLPLSIREGIIDLAFNKGTNKVIENKTLMNAIKAEDYSKIIANLGYFTSGSNSADKTKQEAGLYRRSLSRAILAAKDLTGKELEEAKKEIKALYEKSKKFYEESSPKIRTEDLDNIYKCFTKQPISSKTKYADNFKIVAETGKGLYYMANKAYNAQNDTSVTMQEYREAFCKINKNPQSIKEGEELIAPAIKNVKAILGQSTDTTEVQPAQETTKPDTSKKVTADTTVTSAKENPKEQEATTETEPKQKKERPFWNGLVSVIGGACVGFLAANAFCSPKPGKLALIGAAVGLGIPIIKAIQKKRKQKHEKALLEAKTAFQKMLLNKDTKITKDGDFSIVTMEHEVVKGNTVYGLAKEYQTTQSIIAENNQLENIDLIKVGQKLKIEKLGYKVKKGETLEKIAEKFGLSKEILQDINEIEEGETLKKGQIIELPGFTHTVVSGDTLYGISKKVGVSVENLKNLNNLASDTIHPGDKIKIIFNNSDYDVPDSMKKEIVDKETNTKVETINVSQKYKKDFEREDVLPEVKEILGEKRRVNGKVVATRKVLTAKDLNVKVTSNKLKGKKIIVNAGHGYMESGVDRGALAVGDINDEWILNANNSIRLAKELCANGATVIYLQGRERGNALISNEIKKKENKADLFISVHVNSFDGKTQDRTQIYFSNKLHNLNPKNNINAKSKHLAEIAEKNFDKWIPANETINSNDAFYLDKAKKKQDYAQLDAEPLQVCNTAENNQHIPAILWEVAFMAADKGRKRLKNESLMEDYAKVMTQSIIEYFN